MDEEQLNELNKTIEHSLEAAGTDISLSIENCFAHDCDHENVFTAIQEVADAGRSIAKAITPEAVMGLTAAFCRIADSLSDVAQAIRETKASMTN